MPGRAGRAGGPISLDPPGALAPDDGPIAWIADNQLKGISAEPAVTIHATHAFSLEHWERDRQDSGRRLLDAASDWLGAEVRTFEVHGWLYSKPLQVDEHPCALVSHVPPLVLAGAAFAGPKVEGAALAAGGHAVRDLEVPEGHSAVTWRNHVRAVLVRLFGAPVRTPAVERGTHARWSSDGSPVVDPNAGVHGDGRGHAGARRADRRATVRMVLVSGLAPVATGLAAGLAAAVALSRVTTRLLFGVRPTDPVTYAAAAVLDVGVAAAAITGRARRAVRVDPASVLRHAGG